MRILFVQYFDAATHPPIFNAALSFVDAGAQVKLWGLHISEGNEFLLPKRLQPFAHTHAKPKNARALKLDYVRSMAELYVLARRFRPHWVYASNALSLPLARVACSQGAKLIFHEHDAPESLPSSWFERKQLQWRLAALANAEILVQPNAERLRLSTREAGVPERGEAYVVWNCPRVEEISTPRTADRGSVLSLYFHGSITPTRLPISLLQAMARAQKSIQLRFAGYCTLGYRDYAQQFLKAAAELGLQRQVHYLGTFPDRQELLAQAAQGDLGIGFYEREGNVNHVHMSGASNKIFDYLANELALLLDDTKQWQPYVAEFGYAVDPENVDALAVLLAQLAQQRAELWARGRAGRDKLLSDWNYQGQFAPVLNACTRSAPSFA